MCVFCVFMMCVITEHELCMITVLQFFLPARPLLPAPGPSD